MDYGNIPEGCEVLDFASEMPYQVYYEEAVYTTRADGGEELPLRMYACIPTQGSPVGSRGEDGTCFPAIVYCQGSAWHQQWLWHHFAHHVRMAERGYVVFSVEVRGHEHTVFPSEVDDYKDAVRYVKEHAARFRVDESRIAFWGDSSGAHTALMGAYTAEEGSVPRCVIDWYGPSDLALMVEEPHASDLHSPTSPAGMLLGGVELADRPDLVRMASPVTYVTADTDVPPTLIMHGTDDPMLPFAQSAALYERLRTCGKDVELYAMKDAAHGGAGFDSSAVLDVVERFLKRCMG